MAYSQSSSSAGNSSMAYAVLSLLVAQVTPPWLRYSSQSSSSTGNSSMAYAVPSLLVAQVTPPWLR